MIPLDALSSLTQGLNIPASGVDFKPTGPAPTAMTNPVGEGFQSLLQPGQVQAAQPMSVPDISISGGAGAGPSTWGHMVQQMVMDVNAKQSTAAAKVSDVLQGGPTPVHDAMVATEEASLSFEFLGEMRNKIVDAYNQVMQMQV